MSKPSAKFMKERKRLYKALVKNGCYLFPVKRYRKLPKGMWADISTNDWSVIEEWVDRGFNIAVNTGLSNLLVVDLDPKDDESADDLVETLELFYGEIPNTFTVNTASGGRHFYFRAPSETLGNTTSSLIDHVDTRAVGGYVVGPGSVVIEKTAAAKLLKTKIFDSPDNGPVEYQDFDYQTLYVEDIDWRYYTRSSTGAITFADLPSAYLDKLLAVAESPTKGVACEVDMEDVDSEQAIEGAIDYCSLRHPPAVEDSGGDNTTFQLFTRLRDMGLTEETAVELASDYYNDRCEPPWDFEDLERIASHAYTYAKEPLGIMSAHADFKDDDEETYDAEVLQIIVPETGQVIQPARNQERAAKPQAEKQQEAKEEKQERKLEATDRVVARLNLAFSDRASSVRYVYVATEDEVYNRLSRQVLKPGAFTRAKRQDYIQYVKDEKVTPFEAAEDLGHLVHAESFEYLPGSHIFATHPSDPQSIVWNTYVDPCIEAVAGDTSHFDRYMTELFFRPEDREVALNFMAHRLQNRTRIHSFCLIIRGNHGSGKTLFAQLLGALVGSANYNVVKAMDLKSQFNGWAKDKQVILLDECFDLGTLEIANAMKALVGAKEVSINRKNKNQVKIRNHADYIVTSNYEDALRMDKGERRYYVIEANPAIKTNAPVTLDLLDPIHAMVQDRSQAARTELSAVYHQLMNRDLSKYNPDVLPARTQAMEDMIKANRADWQSFLIEAIDNKEHGFHFDAYALSDIATLLKQAGFNRGLKLSSIAGFLHDNGYLQYKDCRTSSFRKNVVVVRAQEAWNSVDTYGIKKALAEYVCTVSHQAVEYSDAEETVSAEEFLKDFTMDNVVGIGSDK